MRFLNFFSFFYQFLEKSPSDAKSSSVEVLLQFWTLFKMFLSLSFVLIMLYNEFSQGFIFWKSVI